MLDTIRHNMTVLSGAHIDWSLDGGMIWLTTLVVVMGVFFTLAAIRN